MADAHEASGQHVGEKPAEELFGGKSHLSLLVAVGVILPAKGHLLSVEAQQAVIGDRHPMGVAAEVTEHLYWPAESWLGIDDPVLTEEGSQESREAFL